MKIAAAALVACAGAAFADFQSVETINYAGTYSMAQGQLNGTAFFGPDVAYDNTTTSGSFSPRAADSEFVDWGNMAAGTIVNGFQIGYATDAPLVDLNITFYEPGEGFGDASGTIASYSLTGLPGSTTGGVAGWIVDIDLEGGFEFNVANGNIEYGYHQVTTGGVTGTGPLLSSGASQDDAFDSYDNGTQNGGGALAGTFFFGGTPFAGAHMRLYTVPAPTALAVLGMGSIVAGRRRR